MCTYHKIKNEIMCTPHCGGSGGEGEPVGGVIWL